MRTRPDRLGPLSVVLVLLPVVALAQADRWMVTGGHGRFVVERPHPGSEPARPETLDAARFRQPLANGSRIRCPHGSWLALQPPGVAAPVVLRGGDLELVTGSLRASAREVEDRMKTFRRHFETGGARRGSSDRPVCWPDSNDVVWASAATLVLASPISGRAELHASTMSGAQRLLLTRLDVGGDIVTSDELRGWLQEVQQPEAALRVMVTLRYSQGAFTTVFDLASARDEKRGLSLVPPESSDSGSVLLDRSLAWMQGGQLPAAYRDAERAAFVLQSLDAYAVADSIRLKMGCR